MADDRKVIVVGAGLSGLSAAKLLDEAGVGVLVLEASDRIGGRLYSVKNDHCGYVDLGQSYVGPTQDRILRMAKEFNVKTYQIKEDKDLLQYINGKQRRFYGVLPPFKNHISILDANHLFRTIDELGKKIPLDAPWDTPEAEKWDNMTVQQWYDKVIWTDEVMDHARTFARVYLNAEPYEMSLLWFLWYIRGAGGTVRIRSTDNGAQERKFIGGSQQIPLNIARQLGIGTKVQTERPVHKITQTENNVIVTTADGYEFEADHVIMAMSPTMQLKILFEPPLPAQRNQLLQRAPMGSVIKTMVYYDRRFWREKGFCGTTLIDNDQLDLIMAGSMDDTKPDGSFPCLAGFVVADKARHYSKFTKEQRKKKVAESFAKVFQTDQALKPVHYEEKDWCSDPWAGGCYTAFLSPGALTKFGRALRAPCGRVYFAGTETATRWAGYMEGAIQAGERAAREVLHAQGRLSIEKIWQREPESEDFPSRPIEMTFMERNLPSVQNYFGMLGLLGTSAIVMIGFLLKKS